MKSAIKAVDSSLRLILTVFELIVSVAFLLKIFGSDTTSEGGLLEFISGLLETSSTDSALSVNGSSLAGPVTFLVLVLGFMFFTISLFTLAPYILKKQEAERDD